ncbi:MAG: OPT/YSL family transporter [Candidatus Obscuribacterales bacterium]|nr:OPT/YSL family transporter [Candidatus Obscuribacterales bacterium]
MSESAENAAESTLENSDKLQLDWYRNVYQGDNVPQFTLRAVLMGGILGALMSVSNLYTAIKVGWLFGVAITACVLSFTIWRCFRFVNPKLSQMSILENNCMQSTASSAGYSTGSTIATAFGAYLLITGHQIDWKITAVWTLITALLGVLLAVPMKKQMINKERLPFPSGIAAAETLKSLYGGSKEAIYQAYSLVASMVAGIATGVASKGDFAWQKISGFKLPELCAFNWTLQGVKLYEFPGFGFEPSLMLISAGMIVGLRVSLSMLFSSCILYFVFGPWVMNNQIIPNPHKLLSGWALWTGTAMMVSSGLTSFALQWKTIVRAMSSIKRSGENDEIMAEVDKVEVPTRWFLIGIVPLAIIFAIVMWLAFNVNFFLGLLAVVLSFFLALVACRATGETDITPIGAMGKISQLTFAVLSPHNITSNLMAASVTANTASASADLLTDLKSGYLLGANARKQFLAQLCGVFFGTIAIVPAWYLMIPDKATLEAYNPPSTTIYKAVAEALSNGISALPESARMGILIGAVIGLILCIIETLYPKSRKFLPSSMGLGLAWIMPFQNCLSFAIGALLAAVWKKLHSKSADGYTVPIASGAIAGESLACAFIAIINALVALHVFK